MAPSAVPRQRLGAIPYQLIGDNNRINKKSGLTRNRRFSQETLTHRALE